MSDTNNDHKELVIDYITLRTSIGVLGVFLPILLIAGTAITRDYDVWRSSISHYYYSTMGDVFVGILCSYAFFLGCYNGYKEEGKPRWDRIASAFGCVFALGVAFLPTDRENAVVSTTEGTLHYISAVGFFIVLICFCLFLFVRSKEGEQRSRRKILRNRIYRTCGAAMLVCIILIAVYHFLIADKYPHLEEYNPTFWLEAIVLEFFGISWLTKAKWLVRDEK